MTNKTFRIQGSYSKRGVTQEFTKEVQAPSEDRAVDHLYSIIGSNHKVKRAQITLVKVEKVGS